MTEEKEEEKVELTPVENNKVYFRISERDARNVINEIADICGIAQFAMQLPETTQINRTSNFYLEEILRTLKEYKIIIE